MSYALNHLFQAPTWPASFKFDIPTIHWKHLALAMLLVALAAYFSLGGSFDRLQPIFRICAIGVFFMFADYGSSRRSRWDRDETP